MCSDPIFCQRGSSRPGQWRDELSPANVAAFKGLAGDALVQLGYESSNDW